MQLSTRGRYAVMAMAELASREASAEDGSSRPVCLSDIAARQRLSLPYLEQLFARLRRAGLVHSARGPGGGYRLARSPDCLAIAEILAAVREGGVGAEPERAEEAEGTGGGCRTHTLWMELGRQIQLFLQGITLADLLAGRVAGRAVKPPAL
jgi:Rrf2 family transcriptional regulator, iron-sulfur cluster assembly transcription factor